MRHGLQAFIIACAFRSRDRLAREGLEAYYRGVEPRPSHKDQINAVTKALERLIDQGLLIGFGVRTREKWFIREVRLTTKGRRRALLLLGQQQHLPLGRAGRRSRTIRTYA